MDVFISYYRQQPDEFFDASTFMTKLSDQSYTEADLAHVFLKDPGGQFITEKDMVKGK